MRIITALGAAMTMLFSFGAVQAQTYEADRSHSYVGFEIDHLGFSMTQGQFHDYAVRVTANWDEIEQSTVSVSIQTTSVDTAWDPRDAHLRKADFFHVDAFPTMEFTSTAIEKTGENTAKITGDLTMIGVTKSVVLDAELVKRGPYPFGDKKEALGIKASGVLNRSDWGMKYGVPAVSDEVKLIINGELKIAE